MKNNKDTLFDYFEGDNSALSKFPAGPLQCRYICNNKNSSIESPTLSPSDVNFDEKVIKTGFEMGCISATKFALKYFTVDKKTFSNKRSSFTC